MKIINIGILAHVDAGKTTLTESLLYASGAISEPGSVEKGTTRTDTMFLERQRGITIQAAVTSFQWHRCKVNIVDTPGHMDFLAEVYRSLAVLDGAILVISAKDGVQAQTRILFHALRKMNIPTVIFINKIDQAGVDLQSVVQSVRDKLSADIIIKQTVSLSPEIVLEENTDIEAWDAVIENNDKLLEKYIAGEPISREKLVREEQRRVQDASLFPVYYGSAKKGLGIQPLMDAVTGLFQPIGEQGSAALCGSVFKVEYTDCGQRRVYLRLYSGTLRLRDTVALAGREKLKITEMRIPSKGEIVRTDTAYPGEIVILPSDSVRLNDVLGDPTRLPRKRWREDPLPMLRTSIAPKTAAQRERLLDALTQLADTDPLLRCEVDSITHEIILSFLGRVQLEVVSALLSEKYKLEVEWHTYYLYGNLLPYQLPRDFYEKYLKVIKNPSILHYAVDMKPWDCPEHSTAEIFWHYAQKTPFFARIIYKHFEQKIYALSRQKPEKAAVRAAEVQKIPLKDKLKYYRYKFLSFAAFGSKKSYYGEKKRKMKQKIKSIRSRELSAC